MNTKKLIYGILIGLAIFTSSCKDDFLEEDVKTGNNETLYSSPEGLKGLVTSCYAYTRCWYGKEPGIALTEGGTDLFLTARDNRTKGLTTYSNITPAAAAQPEKENPCLDEYWEVFFAAINTCNTALEYIDKSDVAEKAQYLGEISFLRAFYYWHVVETWGAAPIYREATRSASTEPIRNTPEEIYTFMLEDVETAITNLADKTTKTGRVNLWAAKAFKARLLLYYASEYGHTEKYAEAASVAQEVISGSGAALFDNYSDCWNEANQHFVSNQEVIWGIEYNNDLSFNGLVSHLSIDENGEYEFWTQMLARVKNNETGGNMSHLMFTGLWDKSKIGGKLVTRTATDNTILNGIVVNPYFQTYSKGFCRFAPSGYLLDLFYDGDKRYQASFRDTYKIPTEFVSLKTSKVPEYFDVDESDTVIYLCPKRTLDKSLTPKKYIIGSRTSADGTALSTSQFPMYEDIEGTRLTETTSSSNWFYGNNTFISVKKFDDWGTGQLIIRDICPRDVFVFRLSEMYLIKAEAALNGAGGTASSELAELELKRGSTGLYEYNTIEDILDERAREFCGEQIRWFDLKRTGKLTAAYLADKNAVASENIQSHHVLRPIPQVQMDAITNKDVFLQNTGY